MDDPRFDALARSVSLSPSRRAVWRWLAASVLAVLAGGEEPADARKHHKHHKKKCVKAGQAPSKKRKRCCQGLVRDASGHCQSCDVCASGCLFTSVQAAIDAASSGAVITLCAGAYAESVAIAKDLTLIGTGDGEDPASATILDAGGSERVAVIDSPVTVTLQRLRLTGGNTSGGGGIFSDGGNLTLDECTVSGNIASIYGGGINNQAGTLTLTNSTVSGNTAGDGGGIRNFGSTAKLTLHNSTVRENLAGGYGGGIFNVDGTLTLTDSTVSGNTAEFGGGISNDEEVALTSSTVSGNVATEFGGGIIILAGTLTLTDSTVTLNYAGNVGGGIYNHGTVDCGDNNMLAPNTAGNPPLPSDCVDVGSGSGCDCQP